MEGFAAKITSRLSRRALFRIGLGALALMGGRLLLDALQFARLVPGRVRKMKAALPTTPGVHLLKGGMILVKREGEEGTTIRVLSTRCTHLGCELRPHSEKMLICPCHGSRFSINGEVRRGPAMRELPELKYKIDPKKKTITIELES